MARLIDIQLDLAWQELTESCPDRYCGASRRTPGLMGDVTEMDGPIFCDSNELEPVWGVKKQHDGNVRAPNFTLPPASILM